MAETLKIEVDASQIEQHKLFDRNWPKEVQDDINKQLKSLFLRAVNEMQRGIIPDIPRGVAGLLRQSYAVPPDIKGRGIDLEVHWGSDSPYAAFVEYGTRPHFPPPRNLELWVLRKLGAGAEDIKKTAYLIARGISKRGTQAQPVVSNWLDRNTDRLYSGIFSGLDKILDEAIEKTR